MSGLEVIGLDLGSHRCGFACGVPGRRPEAETLLLRKSNEPPHVAYGNLLEFLASRFSAAKPLLVAKEAPLLLRGFSKLETSDAAVRVTFSLHGVVEAVCERYGLRWVEAHPSLIGKHFTGRGSYPSREEKKRATRVRAVQLGYVDIGHDYEDTCDALATWDWACAHHAKTPPRELVMFPPQAERKRRAR